MLVYQDNQAGIDNQDSMDNQDYWDLMGRQVLQEHLDNLEHQGHQELMGHQDKQTGIDKQNLMGRQVLQMDNQDLIGHQVLNRDNLDHSGRLVLMGNQVTQEPQENLGVLVLMGSKKLLDSRDLLVRLVRQAHLANNINDVLTVQVCISSSCELFVLLCEPIENNFFIFFSFCAIHCQNIMW